MDTTNNINNQQAVAAIPQAIRELIADPSTYEKIESIGTKFGLDIVEVGLLAQTTAALLRGECLPNQFVARLINYLKIPQENAALIAQELNRDLFSTVKDALKELHSGAGAMQPTPAPQTPAPTASPYQTKIISPQAPLVTSAPMPSATTPLTPPINAGLPPAPVLPIKSGAIANAQKINMELISPQAARETSSGVQLPPSLNLPEAPKVIPRPGSLPVPPSAPRLLNNLESKLGGTFSIKKEIMFTKNEAPMNPTPPPIKPAVQTTVSQTPATSPNVPTPPLSPPKAPPVVEATDSAPSAPLPPRIDPYRELPT